MFYFITRRLLEAIPTLVILTMVSFALMHMAPGSPFLSEKGLPAEVLANINAKYHLDLPVWEQYLLYIGSLLQGDFGPSFRYLDFSVNDLVWPGLLVSATIGGWALLMAVVIGLAMGIMAALKHNQMADYGLMTVAMLGVVLPTFVMAPLLVLLFAIYWNLLPAGGWNGGQWQYLVLPVIAMGTHQIAQIARITRGSLLEVLHSNFIRTAQAKGLPYRYIIMRHAFKPMILPVVSYLAPLFVGVLTGSVIIDVYFGTGGIGQHFVNGAINRDYSMVMGVTVLVGVMFILFNALADVLYAVIDPKIRY
jgi:oligopeptide transport system permease protein